MGFGGVNLETDVENQWKYPRKMIYKWWISHIYMDWPCRSKNDYCTAKKSIVEHSTCLYPVD